MLKRRHAQQFQSDTMAPRQRPQLAREGATPQPSPAHARQRELQVGLSVMNGIEPAIRTYPGALRAMIWVSATVVCWTAIIGTARAIF